MWYSLGTTSREIYDSDSSLGSSAQQSQRVSLPELPHLEISFVLKLSSAKPKRSSAHLCSSAQALTSTVLMIKLGYLWGLWHNVKGTEKQRGNSGAWKSTARPRIMQRRILARAECMNRITMAGVSMANKKKGD